MQSSTIGATRIARQNVWEGDEDGQREPHRIQQRRSSCGTPPRNPGEPPRVRRLKFQTYEEKKQREALRAAGEGAPSCDGGEAEPGLRRKKLFGEIPDIEGERIALGRVVDADADDLRDLIENPRVQRYLPTYLFEKQFDDAHEAIRQLYGGLFENKGSIILAIRMKDTGELAGLAEFYGLRDRLHKISMGYRLRERWWGHGLATEAACLMVGYLYGETDIEIITASVAVENKASAHMLEKCDFIRTVHYIEEDWGYLNPTIVDKWFC